MREDRSPLGRLPRCMAEPLTHKPFIALNAAAKEAAKVTPIRSGVHRRIAPSMPISSKRLREIMAAGKGDAEQTLVSQPRQPPLPGTSPVESEPVATTEKSQKSEKKPHGYKTKFIMANPDASPADLVKEAEKQGFYLSAAMVHAVRSKAKVTKRKGNGWAKGQKRSPESVAKQRETIAAKKKATARQPKAEARSRPPKANGAGNSPHIEGLTISQLLGVIAAASAEIERRLSQLTL